MRRNVQLIVLFGIVAVVGSLATVVFAMLDLQSATAKSTNQPDSSATPTEDGLEIVQDTKDVIRGSFEEPGKPMVKFHSEVTDNVKNEFVKDSRVASESDNAVKDDKFALTRVAVGSLTINAKRNLRTQTVVDGAGGERITAKQKQALTAFSSELTQSYGPVGSELPPPKDLLVRIVSYYAEAPVGHKLETEKTPKPTAGSKEIAPSTEPQADFVNVSYRYSTDDELKIPSKEECAEAKATRNFVTLTACRRPDNDGIRYLSCSLRTHRLWHDAPNHCGRNFTKYTGPRAYRCRGQCGANCYPGSGPPHYYCKGRGAYTRDCGEHDYCVEHHPNSPGRRGNDRACGDQYKEARDDFFNARINCRGRC